MHQQFGTALTCAAASFLMACGGVEPEGLTAAECGDAIDNDANGLVDCADPGCYITYAAFCDGGTGGDTDTNTQPDTDDDPVVSGDALVGYLDAMTVTYEVQFEIGGTFGQALCSGEVTLLSECNCIARYRGQATLTEAVEDRNYYDGTYEKIFDDCDEVSGGGISAGRFTDGLWHPTDGLAYHGVNFDYSERTSTVDGIDWWLVSGNPDENPVASEPVRNKQFFIYLTEDHGFDASSNIVSYLEVENGDIGPGVLLITTNRLKLYFSEDGTPADYVGDFADE